MTASCWCLLAAIWTKHGVQFVSHFINLVEDGEDTFMDEFVRVFLAEVE